MAQRLPRGGVEVLVHLLELEEERGRGASASTSALREASGLKTWRGWPTLESWALKRGVLVIVREVRRGRIVEKQFALTPRGRAAAGDFRKGVQRVFATRQPRS